VSDIGTISKRDSMSVEEIKPSKQAIAIIPARYASTRLPGKPLAKISGKSLIQRVWEGAARSKKLRDIIIATDDDRVAEECFNIGASCVITPPDLPSGTDRVYYAYKELKEFADVVVNIQGDEPLIRGEAIDDLIEMMIATKAEVGTLVKQINKTDDLFDNSVVKVVKDNFNKALYFSRSTIPYLRDVNESEWLENGKFWKHIGIYAFQPRTLWKFVHYKPSELEIFEKLEQLRLIQNGIAINCVETDMELIGVDTPEDVLRVERYLEMNK
jgi:3-deoxy-manno-octulosonate cytidylyltransferase (CMP-KDO synthetase)